MHFLQDIAWCQQDLRTTADFQILRRSLKLELVPSCQHCLRASWAQTHGKVARFKKVLCAACHTFTKCSDEIWRLNACVTDSAHRQSEAFDWARKPVFSERQGEKKAVTLVSHIITQSLKEANWGLTVWTTPPRTSHAYQYISSTFLFPRFSNRTKLERWWTPNERSRHFGGWKKVSSSKEDPCGGNQVTRACARKWWEMWRRDLWIRTSLNFEKLGTERRERLTSCLRLRKKKGRKNMDRGGIVMANHYFVKRVIWELPTEN